MRLSIRSDESRESALAALDLRPLSDKRRDFELVCVGGRQKQPQGNALGATKLDDPSDVLERGVRGWRLRMSGSKPSPDRCRSGFVPDFLAIDRSEIVARTGDKRGVDLAEEYIAQALPVGAEPASPLVLAAKRCQGFPECVEICEKPRIGKCN